MQVNVFDHLNLAVPVKEIADLTGFDQVLHCGGQRDTLRKSTLPEKFETGIYAHCDVKRYGKLSNAASLLRDIKDSGLQICVFHTMEIFQEKGKLCGIYCIRKKVIY